MVHILGDALGGHPSVLSREVGQARLIRVVFQQRESLSYAAILNGSAM